MHGDGQPSSIAVSKPECVFNGSVDHEESLCLSLGLEMAFGVPTPRRAGGTRKLLLSYRQVRWIAVRPSPCGCRHGLELRLLLASRVTADPEEHRLQFWEALKVSCPLIAAIATGYRSRAASRAREHASDAPIHAHGV